MRGEPTPVWAPTFASHEPGADDAIAQIGGVAGDTGDFPLIATAGVTHVLHWLHYSYSGSGTPAGGNLSIAVGPDDSEVTIWEVNVTDKKEHWFNFPDGIYGAKGEAMQIILAAAGANVRGILNAKVT